MGNQIQCDACSKSQAGVGLSNNLTKDSRIDKRLKKQKISSEKKSKLFSLFKCLERPLIEITKFDSKEVVDFNCISS